MMQEAPAGGQRKRAAATVHRHCQHILEEEVCFWGKNGLHTDQEFRRGSVYLFMKRNMFRAGEVDTLAMAFPTSHLRFLMGSVCCLMTSACYFSFLPLSLTLTRIRQAVSQDIAPWYLRKWQNLEGRFRLPLAFL